MNRSFITRIIAVSVTAIMLLSLTACAFTDAVTAYSLYSKAAKTIEKAGGYEADCAATISIDILGNDMSQTFNINTKQNGKNTQTTSRITGTEIVTTLIGDTVYIETNNQGIKYHVPADDSGNDSDNKDKGFPKLSKDMFEGIEVNKNDDGTRSITIAADGKIFSDFLSDYLGNGGDSEDSLADIKNMVFIFTFDKKGNLETMNIKCDAVITVMEMSLNAKMALEYTFVNFGTAPEIKLNLPEEDYEDGGEYSASGGGIFSGL